MYWHVQKSKLSWGWNHVHTCNVEIQVTNSIVGGKWLQVTLDIVVKVSNADYFKHSVQLSTAPQYVQDSQLNLCGC